MAGDWNKAFPKAVKPRGQKPIPTLAEARLYLLGLPGGVAAKPKWQRAIEALMNAAAGKLTLDSAREAIVRALFLNMQLDFSWERD